MSSLDRIMREHVTHLQMIAAKVAGDKAGDNHASRPVPLAGQASPLRTAIWGTIAAGIVVFAAGYVFTLLIPS
jgi:hypothetical protein